ncbi:transposable element [Nannochloropsis gaditana]|uniref:Transposable element n=1 Tax=Nannochloropsis gaditana TaxID=72520 RepID=W7TIV7_9STRA|nr:transposable element [Nannochloropsis gaditana]
METVGAHQKDDQRPAEDDGNIEDDLHQDEIPDDRDVDHVREDSSQVEATEWKDTDDIIRNMNNMGRSRSKTKARERHQLDDGSTTMGGNLAFAAASEIVNEDYHLTEDEREVRAERKKAKDAEYQAHMRNGTWELTPLPKGERCISSGWVETLQSDLEEKVYVKQPPGYEQCGPNGDELVCLLRKSLYGLKQSGRNWHKKIDGWFRGYGFHPSSADPCLYVKFGSSGEILVIVLYVDDLIIASNSRDMVDNFKQAISMKFSMKDLKELDWILGIAIKRDREKRVMEIYQTAYIDMVLNKFGMADCKPVLTPMEGTLTKTNGKEIKPDSKYMKRVVGYADADYAADKDNRRSTSGYAFTLSHGAKQQDVIALSSAESELISACSATQSAVYIRRLLMDLGFKQDEPTMIMEDNQACIAMGNNPITHKRTKHIDVRYHFVREKVESKEVELDDMMMLREHEISDRRLSEPSYGVAPMSLMDPTVCIAMC